MVKFKVKFSVYDGTGHKLPGEIKHGDSFWCGFNIGVTLVTCKVTYLGDDEIMKQYREYEGIIQLLNGDPYADGLKFERIYKLNCEKDVIGESIITEML